MSASHKESNENQWDPMEIEYPSLKQMSMPLSIRISNQPFDHQNKYLSPLSNIIENNFLNIAPTYGEQSQSINCGFPSTQLNLKNIKFGTISNDVNSSKINFVNPEHFSNQAILLQQILNLNNISTIELDLQMQPNNGLNSTLFQRKVSMILMNQIFGKPSYCQIPKYPKHTQVFSLNGPLHLEDLSNESTDYGSQNVISLPLNLVPKKVSWNSNIEVWENCDTISQKKIIPMLNNCVKM